ncbi:MAG: hypothetical protein A2579_07005 [Lysobacterales bacterium RIFOXYD1_FULL_69_11]|nr:MAG: hypothetical protein A2190_12725 [Xanthomonadales bacterium RIFOXYA1_FULL_69_10]OHE86170.1 MAG: hypothetical protein A2579_07005 [Xanthomonadales bacterium RIFOXYD1_FULL_69_11]
MLSFSVVMLSACTTMDGVSRVGPDPPPMTEEERYVAEVERIARRRGIEVVWVNRPQFKEDLVASADD